MQIRIGLETNIEGRNLAWALDYPGCFAYGMDEAEALIQLPRALLQYEYWINDHTPESWVQFSDLDVRIAERFDCFWMDENYLPTQEGVGYEINAWFKDDWRPLSQEEVERSLKIFHWQREELFAGLTTIDPEILERNFPGQRWNILGIAKHVANAELWYLSRMKLSNLSHDQLAKDPIDRLNQTGTLIEKTFPKFAGRVVVTGLEGEFWSYRKILRRTLWHQRDHIDHIKELVFGEKR